MDALDQFRKDVCEPRHKGFRRDVCDPRYKEVEGMKEDLKDFRECMMGKFNKLYIILLVAALAMIGNLVVKAFG